MFVQISPSETDAPETLCSLSFASRVLGVELGPPKKQSANQGGGEVLKYKQMVRLSHGWDQSSSESGMQAVCGSGVHRQYVTSHTQKELHGMVIEEKKKRKKWGKK